MLDPQFLLHNSHLEDPKKFKQRDPQLKMLSEQSYAYISPTIKALPTEIAGVYTLCGGRQIGKTTLVKQWMLQLLKQGIDPKSIAYFTGEIIVDHLSLIRQLQSYLQTMPKSHMKYIIVDEVTYIGNWDMGVKFLADGGLLENVELVITGSDLKIIQESRMRFPGRRGRANRVNFHIYPLSFYEYLKLTNKVKNLDSSLFQGDPSEIFLKQINGEFENYLIHGGYLKAINNYAVDNTIDKNVLEVYADWVRGDMIRYGKNDHHLREFFTAMFKRLNSQITWTSLAKDFSIEHHSTIADYASLLMSMDAIFIQQALIEDKLVGAVKKARKLIFNDPFIYHAIKSWLMPSQNPFEELIQPSILDSKTCSNLVESCVTSHFNRWYPTYYIKAEGEVNVAYIHDNKFWPIEIKWTEQMRSKDLKQIQKYKNGIILGKQNGIYKVNSTPSYPLSWYLARVAHQNRDRYKPD